VVHHLGSRWEAELGLDVGSATKLLATFVTGSDPSNTSEAVDALDALAERVASIARVERRRAAGEYDVFLCHNSKDKQEVKAVGEQLKEKGYLPWLDEWELAPGTSWQTILESQISQINAAAIFVGPSGIGPWQSMEIQAILRRFVDSGLPTIPVILPSCKRVPRLPMFLQGQTWVDFRALAPDPLKRLIWGFTGKRDGT
jgi:hypothetical protein